jgi:BirA family transcriptional regulator, biotin operon repressor / biotin---[acetyl-CoA-carboxylase] ligase
MDEKQLAQTLAPLPLGGLRYYESIGSTNDEGLAWAADDAPDFSLVVADEQTAGRGRGDRRWLTPPGSALALSLILRPGPVECGQPSLLTGLAALALVDALSTLGLEAQIKWPNDVLLARRKTAGILVESIWLGDRIESSIIGVGINVLAASVPPDNTVLFPATSVESALGHPPDRLELLRRFLAALAGWRDRIGSAEFLLKWEQALAFRGEAVQILGENISPLNGRIDGLNPDGSLRILEEDGRIVSIHFGEMHLRPASN